jgi:hypothetical protein
LGFPRFKVLALGGVDEVVLEQMVFESRGIFAAFVTHGAHNFNARDRTEAIPYHGLMRQLRGSTMNATRLDKQDALCPKDICSYF